MNRSEQEGNRILRAWLDEGTTAMSPRVHDAVLRDFPGITQDGAFGSSRMRVTAYATVVVAAAIVIVVLAGPRLEPGLVPGGVASTVAPSPTVAPTPTPEAIDRSYREVGYIGLPPLGSIPSDTERTDLVEGFWNASLPDGGGYHGATFVYADGRMIWNEYWPWPYSSETSSTGWLEQRLTNEGIELVRGIAVDRPAPDVPNWLDPAILPNQLPASAWADVTVRPYVPTQFAACLIVNGWSTAYWPDVPPEVTSLTLDDRVAMLPDAVTDFLSDRDRTWLLPATASSYGDESCFGMSTADAGLLDAVLRYAGLAQDTSRKPYLLEYHVEFDGSRSDRLWLGIWFEPVLPDGTITCSSCG